MEGMYSSSGFGLDEEVRGCVLGVLKILSSMGYSEMCARADTFFIPISNDFYLPDT